MFFSKLGQRYLTDIGYKNERYFRANMGDFFYKESFGIIKTNKYGFMDYLPKDGKDSKKTINLYGDGFLESMQVFPRLHFGQELAESNQWHIRNFGISGLDLYTIYQRFMQTKEDFPADLHVIFFASKDLKFYFYDDYFPKPEVNTDGILLGKSPAQKSNKVKIIPFFTYSTILNSFNLVRREVSPNSVKSKLLNHPAHRKPSLPTTSSKPYKHNKKEVVQLLRAFKKHNVLFVYIDGEGDEGYIEDLFRKEEIPLVNLRRHYKEEKISPKDLYYFPSTETSGHWNLFAHRGLSRWLNKPIKENVR